MHHGSGLCANAAPGVWEVRVILAHRRCKVQIRPFKHPQLKVTFLTHIVLGSYLAYLV